MKGFTFIIIHRAHENVLYPRLNRKSVRGTVEPESGNKINIQVFQQLRLLEGVLAVREMA